MAVAERARLAVSLAALVRDSRVQPRERINEAVVSEYAQAMAKIPAIREAGLEAEDFPPIHVYREEDGILWLADGWHRVLAAEEIGLTTIQAIVQPGTVYDAIMHAAGANAAHGLRRTSRDKHRAVRMLLDHPTVIREQWSDVRVSVQAGVSPSLVKTVRQEREAELGLPPSAERRGTDGKLYTVPGRTSPDTSRSPVESRERSQDAETAEDASAPSGRLYVSECHCGALLTEPSWHCVECRVHWPLDIYPAVGVCPSCSPGAGTLAAHVRAEPLAMLVSVEPSGGNLREGPAQVPYTPGTMKPPAATLAYERLVTALDLIESVSVADAGQIAAQAPDPLALRQRLQRAREWLLAVHAVSLGVRAL